MTNTIDFIGIGGQRCGTSWLYSCLQEHPQICMPRKEINFFSRSKYLEKGLDWYDNQFSSCESNQKTGEFSTSYLDSKQSPERIYSMNPNIKILVLVREPIKRAHSSFRNDRSAGKINNKLSFEEALKRYNKFIRKSRYAYHLERYLEFFSKNQIWIKKFELIQENPSGLLDELFNFLNVNSNFEPTFLNQKVNKSRDTLIPGLSPALNRLAKPFRKYTFLRPIWWGLKRARVGDLIRSINSRSESDVQITPSVKKKLRKQFSDEIDRLEERFDLNLSKWKKVGKQNNA